MSSAVAVPIFILTSSFPSKIICLVEPNDIEASVEEIPIFEALNCKFVDFISNKSFDWLK